MAEPSRFLSDFEKSSSSLLHNANHPLIPLKYSPWTRKAPAARCGRGSASARCKLRACGYSPSSPRSTLVMSAAAFLPAPMARMTVAAPVTMSPPAQILGLEVRPVSSSATM